MFQSLTDQQPHTSGRERAIRLSVIALISILLFVALYLGVQTAG
jgi:hypothetical protein